MGNSLRYVFAFCDRPKSGHIWIFSGDCIERKWGTNEKMKENKKHLFTNKQLAALLIPIAFDQLLNSFMGTVDTLVVSNIGSAAISAVSLVDAINILIVQAFFALAAGGTVICSQYLGSKEVEKANDAARQLLFVTFFLSVMMSVLCILFCQPILQLIFGKVEQEVMDNAKIYFLFSAIAFPFIALYDDGASILRAQENSRLPMQISVLANILNVILNLLFVWGFHLGVGGSACATMLARAFAMITVLVELRKPVWVIHLNRYFSIRPDWRQIRRILKIGIPSSVENSMFQFGKLAIQSTVSMMGTAAIAAQGMTNIIENLNGIMAIGVGIGMMTVVGECMGAGRKDEAVYYVKKLSVIGEVIVVISCLLLFALVRPITYFGGMEPSSASMCIFMVTCITIVKPLVWTLSFLPAYGFRAAGDVRFSMVVSIVSMWIFRVTLVMILARIFGMGPIAVWIGMFTDWTVRAIIFTVRLKSGRWLEHRVI